MSSVLTTATGTAPLLETIDLEKEFDVPKAHPLAGRRKLKAVRGVSISLKSEETLGLVGESGCGKTIPGRLIVWLESPPSGSIRVKGRDVSKWYEGNLSSSGRIAQMILQDPLGSLNPLKRIGEILRDELILNKIVRRSELKATVADLLDEVGISPRLADRYPSQLSGGQQQRVAIARAVSVRGELIVADKPLSAVDVSIQAQVLQVLERIRDRLQLSLLSISHDLAVVRRICDRVALMYLGEIVEERDPSVLFKNSRHPDTVALISAVPQSKKGRQRTNSHRRRSWQRCGHPPGMPISSGILEGTGPVPRGSSATAIRRRREIRLPLSNLAEGTNQATVAELSAPECR